MDIIPQLLKQTVQELEKQTYDLQNVGNRPGYPMLFLLSDSVSKDSFEVIYKKMTLIWPQSIRLIPFVRYSLTKDGASYSLLPEERRISLEELFAKIDEQRFEHQMFVAMDSIRIVQLVDTSPFSSEDEFAAHYEFGKTFTNSIPDRSEMVLITLLYDAGDRRSMLRRMSSPSVLWSRTARWRRP